MDKGRSVYTLLYVFFAYTIMSILALIYLMPFVRSIFASFMTWAQASAYPPQWIPNPFTLENYLKLFRLSYFPRWVLNTVFVSALIVAANTVTASMAGYAFAILRFPRKELLFSALLTLLMVPPFITLIPNFILVTKLGLIDNLLGLALLGSASVSGIYLMRQYYLSFGKELFEAARIDGADPLKSFFYVALPLSKPALGALAIYQFLGSWNAFLGPLVFLRSVENFTLPVGLNFAFSRNMWTEYTPIIAGSLIASAPTIILYVLLNKYMIKGTVVSAKKG
ncbi:MAG: carbohydrate ABC transporter permease [Infirmifilum uzonense]|uniref:carbohydrate ABC transporter permease n=1 Tax=Infirmifilum TaxID=2856573 RepID=UPI000B1CC883|nr:carbohydrate ABC transporter permease [Infirmifilum uzonense]